MVPAPTSANFDHIMASPHMSSQPSFVSELSYTTSQGSLYELLGGLVGPAVQHTRGDRKQVEGQVKHKAEGKIVVRLPRPCPADIPLPPSPYVAMARKWVKAEEDASVRAAGTRPLDFYLPGLTIDRIDVFSVDTSELIIGE
ncbi:hypothetical protein RSOL_115350 [Rhizoctonia solani AG-3 Rhs1AP]|uniref:Uncharacterized protein n=2 Tax=Rhizoctonia solani AG-3 TaxID=1086053 RepID=A0A074S9K8_9AGAM|nr:hypothetical protein RSOL_115350 [Rhizoctonia solani AG-3 Rhs1AP]KEP46707.1 hypothetical protein V565_185020 [Rhizoctonia solani 123E]